MMHCAINSTTVQAVCWQDGQVITDPKTGAISQYPGFTPTFSADWDGVSGYLINIVGTIPASMPFSGWPSINKTAWIAANPLPVI